MVSEIIIGSNKLFNLVGLTITFLKLNVVIKSTSLLLFTLKRLEFRSTEIMESLWVQIHAKGQSFLLCNTYRPQWTVNEYWSRLTHAIELAHQINENIVISGDLNSNLFNVNNNKLVDLMTSLILEML
jgi:hypothetical protein